MSKKKAYYFQHDSNAREDEKLIALRMDKGAAGYGIYFMLLELLSQSKDCMFERNYNKIGFALKLGAEDIKPIVENYGLFQFTEDGKLFYSARLKEHMDAMQELSVKRSEAGRKGGRPVKDDDKEKTKCKAIGLENETKCKANGDFSKSIGEDIKGKEKKENIFSPNGENMSVVTTTDAALPSEEKEEKIDYERLKAYWNERTGGRWSKLVDIKNDRRKRVHARIAEHGKAIFMQAIEKAVASDYLKDATWFNFDWMIRPNNFDKLISGNYDNKCNGKTENTGRQEVTKPSGGYATDF